MIRFSDGTLVEANGSFEAVSALMKEDGGIDWMLRSETVVDTPSVMARYLLHFWWDGRVVIMETDHPPVMEVPEDDILELRSWCEEKGWKLQIHKDLIAHPAGFDFWLRLFRAGVVHSEVLAVHEKEEIARFEKAFNKLQEEEED
jgi:hypothetical protein